MRNRLRLKQLLLISQVNQLRSLRKVADAMHISQPAATKMLQEIEETLGVRLFERLAKGLEPTLFGTSVVVYADLMLADLGKLRERLVAQAEGGIGVVALGSIPTPVPGLLTETILMARQRLPQLKVSVQIETSATLIRLLEDGRLDVVLARLTDQTGLDQLHFEVLDDEMLSVVAAADHPLARSHALSLADLSDLPWVLQPLSTPMRQLLERAFKEAGVSSPRELVETNASALIASLLQASAMVAILPTAIARAYVAAGVLSILPVRLNFALDPYGIITRRERLADPALSRFLDCLREQACLRRGRGAAGAADV
jgi:DNA-binding transcriptional LysR family regulator